MKDTVIGDMFMNPSPRNEDGIIEGSTDDFPIVFESNELRRMGVEPINKADFKAFLRVMYPLLEYFDMRSSHSSYVCLSTQTPLTYEEWVGALHLSSMWFYTEVCRHTLLSCLQFIVR